MTDLSLADWRKAVASQDNGGCVEVATNLPDIVAIRDSKRTGDGAHVVSAAAFDEFLVGARTGWFDLGAAEQKRTS
jgi:hypothetical protein